MENVKPHLPLRARSQPMKAREIVRATELDAVVEVAEVGEVAEVAEVAGVADVAEVAEVAELKPLRSSLKSMKSLKSRMARDFVATNAKLKRPRAWPSWQMKNATPRADETKCYTQAYVIRDTDIVCHF